jgi:hypothetical protein
MSSGKNGKFIFYMQVGSMLGIWIVFLGIIWWLSNSIRHAVELHDAPMATIAITILAIMVFITLVCILTYVFVGLQIGRVKTETIKQK